MASDGLDRRKYWAVGEMALAAIWFGMLLGVSFVATPAKFLAPSLSLPVALDVGRHTFLVFSRIEWLLSAVLIGLVLFEARSWLGVTGASIVVVLVAVGTFWLLPLLDGRVGMIIAGQQPAPSKLHTLYILFEVAKLFGLLLVMVDGARRLAGGTKDRDQATVLQGNVQAGMSRNLSNS